MQTKHTKPLHSKLLKRLACTYLRRKIKQHAGLIAACVLGLLALFSLCLALRHRMQ